MNPEQIQAIEKLRTLVNKRDIASKRLVRAKADLEKIDTELLPYIRGKGPSTTPETAA